MLEWMIWRLDFMLHTAWQRFCMWKCLLIDVELSSQWTQYTAWVISQKTLLYARMLQTIWKVAWNHVWIVRFYPWSNMWPSLVWMCIIIFCKCIIVLAGEIFCLRWGSFCCMFSRVLDKSKSYEWVCEDPCCFICSPYSSIKNMLGWFHGYRLWLMAWWNYTLSTRSRSLAGLLCISCCCISHAENDHKDHDHKVSVLNSHLFFCRFLACILVLEWGSCLWMRKRTFFFSWRWTMHLLLV